MFQKVLISASELRNNFQDKVIFDCRYRLTDPNYGKMKYEEGHIPGSCFMDLNEHMASKPGKTGGRHPLPDLKKFKFRLEEAGMDKTKGAVCYDDNLSGAARMWFLLRLIGNEDVLVLNGGFEGWIKLGFPVEVGDNRESQHGQVNVHINRSILATHEDVIDSKGKYKIIDAREVYRYNGESEPIDRFPGRIPGAINIPYTELMEDGKLKDVESLKEYFKDIGDGDIIYCGSGVTSCVNFLAMEELGIRPRLYLGSYSDWISRNLEVARTEK